jgi:hypothetical protein
MTRLLCRCLSVTQLLSCAAFTANITGRWNGSLDAGGKPTRLVLVVTEESGDALKAAVELPDMGGIKLPLDGFTKDAAGAVAFELKVSNPEYAGKARLKAITYSLTKNQ